MSSYGIKIWPAQDVAPLGKGCRQVDVHSPDASCSVQEAFHVSAAASWSPKGDLVQGVPLLHLKLYLFHQNAWSVRHHLWWRADVVNFDIKVDLLVLIQCEVFVATSHKLIDDLML